MVNITYPDTTDIIDKIRGAIGREVTFYVEGSVEECPYCSLDPFTNTSTDTLCSGCNGDYWITTYSGATISGHVLWGPSDQIEWPTGGRIYTGDCKVQIKFTPYNLNIVDTSEYVIVDDRKLTVREKKLRGVPDTNRIILDLKLEEGN
jgi:hypothetical protein